MTTVALIGSQKEAEEKESSSFDILVDGEKLGVGTVYYASEEEAKAFRKYLKKKVRRGDAFKIKIVLGKVPDEPVLLKIRDKFLAEFPMCDASRILFLSGEGDKAVPLTDGKKLEEKIIGSC